MKKEDIPQDKSALENYTREVCYAKNKDGKYETVLSTGWQVKTDALENAWEDIEKTIEEARIEVAEGRKSPVYYFMELRLMDLSVLSGYTGFWKVTIKNHMKPNSFRKLSEKKLRKYAEAFEITLEELINFRG